VKPGDRIATISPNTHAHLEAYYAVPQIGAVIVPINFRLTAADFAYILNHSGARVVCVHSDYLDAVDSIRDQVPGVEHFIAFSGRKDGWIDYEATLAASAPDFTPAEVVETEMIALNYTSGTTANPKGVMVTHRNTALEHHGPPHAHAHHGGGSLSLGAAHVSRERLVLRLDDHRRRRPPRLYPEGRS
jgi:fatty-acyl-CoA synthase